MSLLFPLLAALATAALPCDGSLDSGEEMKDVAFVSSGSSVKLETSGPTYWGDFSKCVETVRH